jgi:hypothetical protein
MSTPSGKSLNLIDPSASESHETHEWVGAEQHPVENDYGPLQSPYAPEKARAQPTVEQDFAIGEEAVAPAGPRATEGLRENLEWRAVEAYSFSHDTGAPRIHAGNNFHEEQPAPAASCHEMARDLKRLAASVRWVQREEVTARIPRAAQPRSVSGFAPIDARGRGYGKMFDNGFSSRSLEPEGRVPPPAMRLRRDTLHGPLIILIVSTSIFMVSIFTAPIAHYFSVGGWSPTSKPPPGPQMASFDSKFITVPLRSSSQESSRTIIARDDDPGTLAEGEISYERSKLSSAAKSFARAAVATLPPGTLGAQDPPLSTAVRALNPDEIMLLMKQGEQFIAAGDVLAARISFQRAAEAGDAAAAVALGATYDPTVLATLGVVGMSADVAKARRWYEKAKKLGSPEARWRLESDGGR